MAAQRPRADRDSSATIAKPSTAARYRGQVRASASQRYAPKSGRRSADATLATTATIALRIRMAHRFDIVDSAKTRSRPPLAQPATSAARQATALVQRACFASIHRRPSAALRVLRAAAARAHKRAPRITIPSVAAMRRPIRTHARQRQRAYRFSAKAHVRRNQANDSSGKRESAHLGL